MRAAQWHAGTDAQVHGSRRGVDYTPGFVGATCAGAHDEALPAQRGIEHLLQGAVEGTNTHMHDALSQASTFSGLCCFAHFKGYTIVCLRRAVPSEACILMLHMACWLSRLSGSN